MYCYVQRAISFPSKIGFCRVVICESTYTRRLSSRNDELPHEIVVNRNVIKSVGPVLHSTINTDVA